MADSNLGVAHAHAGVQPPLQGSCVPYQTGPHARGHHRRRPDAETCTPTGARTRGPSYRRPVSCSDCWDLRTIPSPLFLSDCRSQGHKEVALHACHTA
jgi:hypothetical protein